MASEISKNYFGKSHSEVRSELKPAEKVDCPLCHISPKLFAVDYQGFQLCRCPQCGLEFTNPRLSFEQLSEKVYTDSYFPKQEQPTQPGEIECHQFERQLSDYKQRLGQIGKILDIGCGNGSFLHYAQKQGWEIFGADIGLSTDARRLMCPLWEGRLEDIDFGEIRFDMIRFNHVLEHTQNPLTDLKRSRELLNSKGIIYISVPNITGISSRLKAFQSRLCLKRHRWRHYAAMHHLFFFSPRTLRLLIEAAGLRVLHWETPVLTKSSQPPLMKGIYQHLLESSHNASIMDFYCTID